MLAIEIGNYLDAYDLSGDDFDKVSELEDALRLANRLYMQELDRDSSSLDSDSYRGSAEDVAIADALYDRAIEVLRRFKPDSDVITQIYESETGYEVDLEGDFAKLNASNGMKSIMAVKSINSDEFTLFSSKLKGHLRSGLEFFYSVKLNGWGIQLFYRNGRFVSAYSRARSSSGLDLTDVMRVVLGRSNLLELSSLRDVSVSCIRGELHLPIANLDKAREYNSKIVHPLSAVNSLRGVNVPEEYKSLLEFTSYRYIDSDMSFGRKSDEYSYLESLGFSTPYHDVYAMSSSDSLEDVVNLLLEDIEGYNNRVKREDIKGGYYSDGIVMQLENLGLFSEVGGNSKYDFGAIAIKMGTWEQSNYVGYVQYVSWGRGKSKLSPVAIVAEERDRVIFEVDGCEYRGLNALRDGYDGYSSIVDSLDDYVINYDDLGVVTGYGGQVGNRVRRVPLFNLNGLVSLGVELGQPLNFRYGAESGVVPCDRYGNLYLSDEVQSLYRGE